MLPVTVPDFNSSGVLPSFSGTDATSAGARSPYRVSINELVSRFTYTRERAKLLLGLNAYRETLFNAGFTSGFQWIDGSFVEDVERMRGRPPRDIDVVTLFRRPASYTGDLARWQSDFRSVLFVSLFETRSNKAKFQCDTYPIDMDSDPESLVAHSNYWLGLFSETRGSNTKKGIVSIPLATDRLEFSLVSALIKAKQDV